MAIIPCPECQKEVSTEALSCPQCAFPYPGRMDRGNGNHGRSLRTCPDCKRLISKQAPMCPHCGAPNVLTGETPESSTMGEGEETWMCPNCGVPYTRRATKGRKPVEENDILLPDEEKSLPVTSKKGQVVDKTTARDGQAVDPSLPTGRKRKKSPLWEEARESYHQRPRSPRPQKRRWTHFLIVMIVVLLSVFAWAVWELQDMSGLEALVFWNL